MRDVITIPTYNRPEYLEVCLDHIMRAEGAQEKTVLIQHDFHFSDYVNPQTVADYKQVIEKFHTAFRDNLRFGFIQHHANGGNSWNVFSLYKQALAEEPRYVFHVEDDVLVSPDFFKWHEAVQARGDYFATVGWKCIRNRQVVRSEDPTAYIESTRDFASIGVCWRPEKLASFVSHATPAYFANPSNYFRNAFPGSPIPDNNWTEQDGIITRMLHETKDRWCAWPLMPRCTHVGIQGYHRAGGHRFDGNLEQRVDELRSAAYTPGMLARLSRDPYNDVSVLESVPAWEPSGLHVTQRFNYEEGKI